MGDLHLMAEPSVPPHAEGRLRRVPEPTSHNLPVQLTSFVGREAELLEVHALLAETRLLSVTGAGGCGKTRIALQLAADVRGRYPGGAWLVELAAVSDDSRVLAAIASELGERDLTGNLVEAIAIRVGDDDTLLVLDNCEHLLDVVASTVDALLRRCETLSIVATSREPLGVPGETAWRVPSMPVPEVGGDDSIGRAATADAVRLFVERAIKVRPNFRLTTENVGPIIQVCSRLDGIPLAVELAAARVRSLPVEQVADALDDRFRLLTGGARTALPRQQTLEASVDWSHDLLSDDERAVFRRLAIFAGGFTLDAAEQVVAGDGVAAIDVLDRLMALVDKSMIEYDDDRRRYRMLETLRHYANSRLLEHDEMASTRQAHLAWAAGSIDPIGLLASDSWDSGDELEDEVANFRTGFEWAALAGESVAAARLSVFFSTWETRRGDPAVAIAMARQVLELPGLPAADEALARATLAWSYYEAGDVAAATDTVDGALGRLEGLDDVVRAVCLQSAAAALQYGNGFTRVPALLEASIAAARRAGLRDLERKAISLLALAHFLLGDRQEGERTAAEIEWISGATVSGGNLAYGLEYSAWMTGDFGRARELVEVLGEIPRPHPRLAASRVLSILELDLAQGVESGIAEELEDRLAEARRRGFWSAVGQLGWGPGIWHMTHGEVERGAREVVAWRDETKAAWGSFVIPALITLGRLEEAREAIESERTMFWGAEAGALRATYEVVVCRLEGDLTEAERLVHLAIDAQHEGAFRPILVHSMEALAGLAAARGAYPECARVSGAAQTMRDALGYVLRWPYETELRDADLDRARAALGDAAFDVAFDEGRALDEDAAVAYALRARGERSRPTVGWDSLTPTESEVVALVAAGLTNKQIGTELLMGAETVKTHLSHVYDKLGVRSRAKLATDYAGRTA